VIVSSVGKSGCHARTRFFICYTFSVKKEILYTVGIDEAGRGPLAGPVAVGVVIAPKNFNKKLLTGVRDSKKLSHAQREAWFEKLKVWKKEGELDYAVALVSAHIIDTKGITFAIKKGMKECLKKVKADSTACEVLLDGSLKAPEEFKHQKTIIKGDDKIPLISLASIAAKVTRDRKMLQMAKVYPKYNFEVHKGYGTAFHRHQIQILGPCEIHRQSFIQNILKRGKEYKQ